MARKVINYTIETEGRDKGKTFVITEMDAWSTEAWATEAIFAIMNCGVKILDSIDEKNYGLSGFVEKLAENYGLSGLAALGVTALAKLPYDKARPLLDRLLECVKIKEPKITRAINDDDIEEVSTLLQLKKEVLKLHLDFFIKGGQSITESLSASKTKS